MYGLWLALSGHYTPLLLGLGLASAVLTTLIGARMGTLDGEGLPIGILWRLPRIALWLVWEILKSNWGVVRVIMRPARARPQMVRVNATQRTIAALVTHANFITLTPGTVAVDVDENENVILVHGLTQDFCDGVAENGMNAQINRLEQ